MSKTLNFSHHADQSMQDEIDLSEFNVIYEGSDSLPIRAACFSPDGQFLSIGSNSKLLNVYCLENIIANYVRLA